MKLRNLVSELRRRRVFRVAAAYAVVAWLAIQVGEATFPAFGIPDWAMRLVVVLAIIGFPVAIVLAWAFDLTPSGVERTLPVGNGSTSAPQPGAESEGAAGTSSGGKAATTPAPEPLPHSIAVLPFSNLSAEPENEYFSDGITEDLIAHLARVRDLKVISRTSVMQYKHPEETAREIGQKLGVATILEGSVRRSEGQVRIVAQLIDTRTDHHLWSETYDRELKDIFEIQADVAGRITESLRAELTPRERQQITAAPTHDLAAYDLYLRGRHEWNFRTDASLSRSLDYLRQAVAADPGFALAFAGLADSYLTLGVYGARAPKDVMPQARMAAEAALQIDGEQAEALTSLASVRGVYEWDWEAAERDFRRAIDLSPNYPVAHHWYAANLLMPLRRFDEARAELTRAVELDPLAPSIGVNFAILDFFGGRYEAAAERCSEVIESHPGFWLAYYFLGLTELEAGAEELGVEALEKARDLSSDSVDSIAALGYAHALSGREKDARAILRELQRRNDQGYVSPIRFAQVHLALGETDRAFEWVERAVEAHAVGLIWLDVQPIFRELREDPRIQPIRGLVFA